MLGFRKSSGTFSKARQPEKHVPEVAFSFAEPAEISTTDRGSTMFFKSRIKVRTRDSLAFENAAQFL